MQNAFGKKQKATGDKGIATRSKKLLVAGITTSNKGQDVLWVCLSQKPKARLAMTRLWSIALIEQGGRLT